jgi:putative nucleotidyltransferase with HDIG domain
MIDRNSDKNLTKPAKRCLVVDNDLAARATLCGILASQGFEIIESSDGREARDTFMMGSFDFVFAEIRIPGISGIQLLHSIKKNSTTPVILMSSSIEVTEQEAFNLGARAILFKPHTEDAILDALVQFKSEGTETTIEIDVADQYSQLSIDDLIVGKKNQFDIYIKLSNVKFVKIVHVGETIPVDRLQGYKSRGIRYLYLKKEDFARYLGFSLKLLQAANSSKTISKEKKIGLLKHTGEIIAHQIQFEGMDIEIYEQSKVFVETSVSLLSSQDDIYALLNSLSEKSNPVYTHSVAVSTTAILIAREMQWTSPQNLFKIGMGGLMHDIGKSELDIELLKKPRREMTVEEMHLMDSHPQLGVEILEKMSDVPADVLQIVLQHHENCIGQGFPHRLRKNEIHPMARLIAVADKFCNLVLNVPGGPQFSPQNAVENLIAVSLHLFDSRFINALARIFKVTHSEGGNRKPF